MAKKKINIHSAASIVPLMPANQLEDLADSILENGLKRKIATINSPPVVVDGRNRLRACEMAGVEPQFVDLGAMSKEEALKYSYDMNFHTRHLSDSQRAMVQVRYALEMKELNGEVIDMSISQRTVSHASKVIKKGAVSVQEAVESGELAVSVAAQAADLPKREQMALMRKDNPVAALKAAIGNAATKGYAAEKAKLIATVGRLLRMTDDLARLKKQSTGTATSTTVAIKAVLEDLKTNWK